MTTKKRHAKREVTPPSEVEVERNVEEMAAVAVRKLARLTVEGQVVWTKQLGMDSFLGVHGGYEFWLCGYPRHLYVSRKCVLGRRWCRVVDTVKLEELSKAVDLAMRRLEAQTLRGFLNEED